MAVRPARETIVEDIVRPFAWMIILIAGSWIAVQVLTGAVLRKTSYIVDCFLSSLDGGRKEDGCSVGCWVGSINGRELMGRLYGWLAARLTTKF